MTPTISNFHGEPQARREWRVFSPGTSVKNDRSKSSSRLEPMITVIGLTQFCFMALAIAMIKILVHSASSISPFARWVDVASLWLFLIPAVWTVFAAIVAQTDNGPLLPLAAHVIGILLAVLSFLFLVVVVFYLPAYL